MSVHECRRTSVATLSFEINPKRYTGAMADGVDRWSCDDSDTSGQEHHLATLPSFHPSVFPPARPLIRVGYYAKLRVATVHPKGCYM